MIFFCYRFSGVPIDIPVMKNQRYIVISSKAHLTVQVAVELSEPLPVSVVVSRVVE